MEFLQLKETRKDDIMLINVIYNQQRLKMVK